MSRRGAGVLIWAFALVIIGAACDPVEPSPPPSGDSTSSPALAPPPTAAPTTTTKLPTTTTTKAPTTTTTQPTTPLATAEMPTRANTGPSGITGTLTAEQFLTSGVCDHQRITEQVRD